MNTSEMTQRKIEVVSIAAQVIAGLRVLDWLAENAPADARWLLAHSYAGVIWGRQENGRWKLSSDFVPELSPRLEAKTLLQARLFGEGGELLAWRDGDSIRARKALVDTDSGNPCDCYQEHQWLWGTRADLPGVAAPGFTLLADGAQGLRHLIPIDITSNHFLDENRGYRPARLTVEHFVRPDETSGLARVWLSRLVKVFSEPVENTVKEAA